MAARVADAVDQWSEFEGQGFLAGAAAEIQVHGADQFVLVSNHGGFKRLQRHYALGISRFPALEGSALFVEEFPYPGRRCGLDGGHLLGMRRCQNGSQPGCELASML